jgi:hypothetical protein
MPPLQAKRHKIQSLWQVWNGNVPIAPILMRRICQRLFLEIPLRLDKPASCAITCAFHQVMVTQLWELINKKTQNIVTNSLFTVFD